MNQTRQTYEVWGWRFPPLTFPSCTKGQKRRSLYYKATGTDDDCGRKRKREKTEGEKEWQSKNERKREEINWKVKEKKTSNLSLHISIPRSLLTERRDKILLISLSLSLSLLKEMHANVQQDHLSIPSSLSLWTVSVFLFLFSLLFLLLFKSLCVWMLCHIPDS